MDLVPSWFCNLRSRIVCENQFMSSLSVMEWNAKSPLQWDWEHLVMFNATTAQFPKKLQPTDWRIEGEVGADAAPLHPSGSGCGFGSDLGHGSLSKSSKSASSNSALVGKESKFTIEKGFPGEFNSKKELSMDKATRTSLTLDASVKSGEPLIGLKLGKRTYFEDFSLGSNTKSSSISVIPMSSSSTTKKSRSCAHATRCQVEGCNLDLSSAKEYHQKHRICNIHAKCPKVIVGGLERRFCQQCSRFHSVSEFDEKKRSCRKRLSDHNARRRKPRFEEFQFNSARLSSSLNDADEMKHIGFVLNRVPLVHTRPPASSAGESTCNSKFTQTKWYPLRLAKPVGNNGQLHFPSNDPAYTITTLHNDSNRLMPSKDATDDVLNQGLEESIVSSRSVSSNLDATQDLHQAPSLLSTNYWGSCQPEPLSLDNPLRVNDTTMSFSVPQYSSIAVSEYWQTEQQSTDFQAHTLTPSSNGSNHFQELQMFSNKWN